MGEFRITVGHNSHVLDKLTMFLVVVQTYQWPYTGVVQQLRGVEAYVYLSVEIHLSGRSRNLLRWYVRRYT